MYVCIYIYMNMCIFMYIFIYIYLSIYINIYLCIYIYIYFNIYIYTHPLPPVPSPADPHVQYSAVSSFVFLRFFAVAVLSPHSFQLRSHHPVSVKSRQRRAERRRSKV